MSGFEERWRALIANERPGLWEACAQAGLSALAGLYGVGVGAYRLAYDWRLIRSYRLPCPVVTIGNLTVGGTGKTTTARWMARQLQEMGHRPAVLSYGFRSGAQQRGENAPIVVSGPEGICQPVEVSGDEAQLLARSLPGVPVLIGPRRVQSGVLACERFQPTICVLDDGFQYWRLKTDLRILMVNADNPLGYSHLLPRGLLREPLHAIRRAEAVILSHADAHTPERLARIHEQLYGYNDRLVIAETRHAPQRLRDLRTGATFDLDLLCQNRWLALSSIGHPEGFERGLTWHGGILAASARYPDHYSYTRADLEAVANQARRDRCAGIITTEKDAVKITPEWTGEVPCYVLEIDLEFLHGEAPITALLGDRVGGRPEQREYSSSAAKAP